LPPSVRAESEQRALVGIPARRREVRGVERRRLALEPEAPDGDREALLQQLGSFLLRARLGLFNELSKVGDIVAIWRERLANISWFMALLNQHIAREANKEDE
jgi:hypothetical protein